MKPILAIWIKPRQTFQVLEERGEEKNNIMVNSLFFLTSMTTGFSNAIDFNKLIGGNYYISLVVALIVSGLFGLFLWNTLFSWIIYMSSKLFEGKATKEEIKLTLSYSLAPNLVHLAIGLILIIPAIAMNNKELINFHHPIITFGLWIIAFRALLFGLAYFNKYSYGYALLTVLIPAAIIQGLVYGIKYLIN